MTMLPIARRRVGEFTAFEDTDRDCSAAHLLANGGSIAEGTVMSIYLVADVADFWILEIAFTRSVLVVTHTSAVSEVALRGSHNGYVFLKYCFARRSG